MRLRKGKEHTHKSARGCFVGIHDVDISLHRCSTFGVMEGEAECRCVLYKRRRVDIIIIML